MRWLKRLKAALSIGAVWGAAGAGVGSVIGALAGFGNGAFGLSLLIGAVGFGTIGLVNGTAFALVLSIADGRRSLDELSPGRAGVWGALVGGGIPFVTNVISIAVFGPIVPLRQLLPVIVAAVASYGVLTGLLAAGTVAIAKRAPDTLPVGESDQLLRGAPQSLSQP